MVIGSKNFSEQVILGELMAQHIENHTGLTVDRRLSLGSTFLCHQALRAGEIDAYVEYTGTAFTAILKQRPIHDPQEVYRRVREQYWDLGIEWMKPLGFNNTFAIIVRGEDARRLNLKTISDAAAHTPKWLAGFGYEFIERKDGFRGLSETYQLKFAEPPRVMELGLTYRALAGEKVDLIAGDSTSGLINALDLFVLRDEKRYFPPYDAALLVRRDTLDLYPELRGVLEELEGVISEEMMRRMNYQVDGKKRDIKQVVSEFLEKWGMSKLFLEPRIRREGTSYRLETGRPFSPMHSAESSANSAENRG